MATAGELQARLDIDLYIQELCVPHDATFEQALRDAVAANLPEIHISPNEGKLLHLLAKIAGARRILEIGLLGGYSTLWLASALPADGELISLEISEEFARVARKNLDRAGLLPRVDIRVAPAQESLAAMVRVGEEPFDVVFIDADKEGYPAYLDFALRLTHPGSLILADNVLRDGGAAPGIKEFNQKLTGNPRLEAIILPIIRHKVDGLAIARVL